MMYIINVNNTRLIIGCRQYAFNILDWCIDKFGKNNVEAHHVANDIALEARNDRSVEETQQADCILQEYAQSQQN